jgi:hypothetical protein
MMTRGVMWARSHDETVHVRAGVGGFQYEADRYADCRVNTHYV